MNTNNKIYLEADIKLEEETPELKEQASKIIELPSEADKQPDLLYCSAVFVSSGENLNHAYFMGSELITAEGTITNKAMDVEHNESSVVGHIYKREFMDQAGNKLDLKELASKEKATQDSQKMHIAIACVLYKNRFPNFVKEVSEKKWKVSMECYYEDYDVKVGELILDKKEAEMLGLAATDSKILGTMTKVIKNGVEIASGAIVRVLRGICFSGCGFVKNPANPASIVLETANTKDTKGNDNIIVLNYDELQTVDNNVTSDTIEGVVSGIEKARDGALDDTVGICVSYKRRVYDKDENIVAKDWCALYEKPCTSFSRDTTDVNCLKNREVLQFAKSEIERRFKKLVYEDKDRRKALLYDLQAALSEAVKSKSRKEE
ncbi:hypothetical protein KAW18_03550 [candidate division WOR-3 bacterium]|nr:hypothetical protein [candidate division WOR-3 bacterium]